MNKLTPLIVLTLTLNAFSLMPPWVYKEMQDSADEFIEIEVISLSLDTTMELVPVTYVKTVDVLASAIVTKVESSKNGLSTGDTITIGYEWENNESYYIDENSGDTICVTKIGGGQAPILDEKQKSTAFLNFGSNIFQPAALGYSFRVMNYVEINKSIPNNKFVNRNNLKHSLSVLPNGRAVNTNNKELAKGMYLKKGLKLLNIKSK